MDKEKIEIIIQEIMINDGADRHIDGSNIITEFIVSLLNGKGNEWFKEYCKIKGIDYIIFE